MVSLERGLAKYVLENCPARTDEALMERFGISYNTLRKIEAGSPVRHSLAVRLENRLKGELRSAQATGWKQSRTLERGADMSERLHSPSGGYASPKAVGENT